MRRDQEGRVWLVAGATGAIGAAVVDAVAARGGRTVLVARSEDRLRALAERNRARHGAETLVQTADVTLPGECERMVREANAYFGAVDQVVYAAEVHVRGYFVETDREVYRRVMEVNFMGAVNCLRAALQPLRQRRGGFVAVSSIAGLHGFPSRSAYAASKAALNGFLEAVRPSWPARGCTWASSAPRSCPSPAPRRRRRRRAACRAPCPRSSCRAGP